MRKLLVLVFFGTLMLAPSSLALAQTSVKDQAKNYMNIGAESAGLKNKDKSATDFKIFIAEFAKFFMAAYGMIFIILMVVAGYWLMTAKGDEEQVKKAISTIQGAVIGLFIILSAWGISTLVARKAMQATGFGQGVEKPE